MAKRVSAITFVVPNYDEGIAFFVDVLGFHLIDDTPQSATKRWVLVAAEPAAETRFLLAKADGPEQSKAIGNQTGGRVGFFLETDDFVADYAVYQARGLRFLETPRVEPYGTVAVFQDPFGNKWDLIQFS
jgi:catechol 2,3-dioxygenase-like lactoylglutathione lyase family enzyme